jgi:hypothetical protein
MVQSQMNTTIAAISFSMSMKVDQEAENGKNFFELK